MHCLLVGGFLSKDDCMRTFSVADVQPSPLWRRVLGVRCKYLQPSCLQVLRLHNWYHTVREVSPYASVCCDCFQQPLQRCADLLWCCGRLPQCLDNKQHDLRCLVLLHALAAGLAECRGGWFGRGTHAGSELRGSCLLPCVLLYEGCPSEMYRLQCRPHASMVLSMLLFS